MNFSTTSKKIGLAALVVMCLCGCQKDDTTQPAVASPIIGSNATAEENIALVSTLLSVSDVARSGLQTEGIADGRIGSKLASGCGPATTATFTVDRSHADSIIYTGSLVADYGQGLSCDPASAKKGKFTDAFVLIIPINTASGYKLTHYVSFQNFQSDSLILNGEFVGEAINGSVSISLQEFKVTYADGATTTVSGSLALIAQRNTDGSTINPDGSTEVSGGLNGINREGQPFNAQITQALLFNYSCSLSSPVSGAIDFSIANSEAVIDFGAGVCDNSYTIVSQDKTTDGLL